MSSQPRLLVICLIVALCFGLGVSVTLSQDAAARLVQPDVPVSGTLDTQNVAQVYTFTAVAGQQVRLTATNTAGLQLALLLTDAAGVPLAQVAATESNDAVEVANVTLATAGTYYVTIFSVAGVPEESAVFQLLLEVTARAGEFTPPGELLTVTGLQVRLEWNSTANLNLEVRDPVGGSLFFSTPEVASGGRFGVNANSVCGQQNAENPFEEASWAAGVIPTGSYELLVYYDPLQDCPTTETASFTLNVTVDGTPATPVSGSVDPNRVYIASFILNADGSILPGRDGLKVDPPVAPSLQGIAPLTLERDFAVTGAITSAQPFVTYAFDGVDGDVVSLQMTASSGNLDTLLLLLDPNGNVVAFNDDVERGNTNSALQNVALLLNGTYTVVATRYGQDLGGTQGEYGLTLSGAVSSVVTGGQEIAIPDLPNLPNGSVEVSLQWNSLADLQLLVRDPLGQAVFDDQPQVPGGGTLAANGNVNCTPAEGSPVSYIYWPEGRLPSAGPYEIEVQYQSQCNDTSPVQFTLNVVVNGQLVFTSTQQPRLGERYVASFNIGLDGTITAGEGGFFGTVQRPDVASLDYNAELENARVLTGGETVTGSIRLNRKFEVFVFDGTAGQVVTVDMDALSGTLDPVLFLVDPNGVQVAQNDDAPGGRTINSLISEFTLLEDGRYIIIATHFGARFGVTAGDYNLTLRLN
ncbi:MAG: PPC domain-containing protein [Anaerolineae bacterium]|nr:PPC domain-containing protein [Anaerolineae bacterium]